MLWKWFTSTSLHPRTSLNFSGFYYSIDDFIIFRNDPNWRGVYNIDKATLTGLSAEGKARTPILADRIGLRYLFEDKKGRGPL